MVRVRTNSETPGVAGMPEWQVEPNEFDPDVIVITCPSCEEQADVVRDWLTCNDHKTRPCTYCFRCARVPVLS